MIITKLTPMTLLMCAAGGALGAIMRLGVAFYIATFKHVFPYATLIVNATGCFILGLLIPLVLNKDMLSTNAQAFFIVGFIGALTTFSAFTLESYNLLKAGAYIHWAVNIIANVFFCLFALVIAMKIVE